MPHDLKLLRTGSDDKSAIVFEIGLQFGFVFSELFHLGLLDQAGSSDSKVLSKLNVLLLSSELFEVLLDPIDQILGNGRFRIGPVLSYPATGLSVAQVQLRQNLVSRHGISILACTFSLFLFFSVAETALLLNLALAVLLGDLKAA